MSAEDLELIRKAFENQGLGDLAEVAHTYWHPDIVYVEDARWPERPDTKVGTLCSAFFGPTWRR
jgi:hypothetical protein